MPQLASPPHPIRAAMLARDPDALAEFFGPDAVFHSPLTGALSFRGGEQIRAVLEVIVDVFDDLRYTDEVRNDDTVVLMARARIRGTEIEIVDRLRLGVDGKIEDFTVWFRPLPAAAVALQVIGAGLGRRRSTRRGTLISVLARPLAVMSRVGDRAGVRLIRSCL